MSAKHTIETATQTLNSKNLSFLSVKNISATTILLYDHTYGEYSVDIKVLAPSMSVPLHKKRRRLLKFEVFRQKYVGTTLGGYVITDVFYGPDKGYKNRSFLVDYNNICGHSGTTTLASLKKHKKNSICRSCALTTHGERTQIEGKLKARTPTYTFWLKSKKSMPEKFKEFTVFYAIMGDKPYKSAEIRESGGTYHWVNRKITDDEEINLMAMALRQAFRHSTIYKSCIAKSKVETDKGTRYRCALCGKLTNRTAIQVDHIEPIVHLSGTPLLKTELIDRIWTDKIQILDKPCHTVKSTTENKIRKQNKLSFTK